MLFWEYWHDKQFAVRAIYFHENSLKGDRKYLTLGLGLKYNIFGMNLSYLVPTTNNRSPSGKYFAIHYFLILPIEIKKEYTG